MKIIETEAYTYALKKLKNSDSTCLQIKKLLKQKGCKEEIIKKVIKYLLKKGYLNDKRYAINFLNKNIEIGKKGPLLLYYELRKKGIRKEICKTLINELYTPENEIEAMKKLNLGIIKEKKKLILKLKRKGFRLNTILKYANLVS